MPVFNAIAAMSENRVIGYQGKIPWHLPDDFRWFKHKTLGETLVMGRKTFASIGKPLPGRKTVVLTKSIRQLPGVQVYPNVETLLAAEAFTPKLWVCGGSEIYAKFLPQCSVLYLTRVKRVVEGDAFFPPFEDLFALHQVIHKTPEFQVECWFNTRQSHHAPNETGRESWPFSDHAEK
jgi:dihydrofolate reductase